MQCEGDRQQHFDIRAHKQSLLLKKHVCKNDHDIVNR